MFLSGLPREMRQRCVHFPEGVYGRELYTLVAKAKAGGNNMSKKTANVLTKIKIAGQNYDLVIPKDPKEKTPAQD